MTNKEKRQWAHALVDKVCDLNEQGKHYASVEVSTDINDGVDIHVYAMEGGFSKEKEYCLTPGFPSERSSAGYYEKLMFALDELYRKGAGQEAVS